jgi:RNA polymerase sigma-70 factor (ECF subfamily)
MNRNDDKLLNSKEEDRKIIQAILEGDVNKFAVLQKKYHYLIYSLVRKIIKDDDDVEDVLQETFIKAYNALSSYSFEYAFSSWIYKIASNSCIDFLRKKKNLIYYERFHNEANEDDKYQIEDDSFTPEGFMIDKEKKEIIKNAIYALPSKYKELILMRHEEELSYQEISEKLDIPLGTVKVNLFRARKILELQLRKFPTIFNIPERSKKT